MAWGWVRNTLGNRTNFYQDRQLRGTLIACAINSSSAYKVGWGRWLWGWCQVQLSYSPIDTLILRPLFAVWHSYGIDYLEKKSVSTINMRLSSPEFVLTHVVIRWQVDVSVSIIFKFLSVKCSRRIECEVSRDLFSLQVRFCSKHNQNEFALNL